MSNRFAEIAFPTPVRRCFTYSVPAGLELVPGVRVWVSFGNQRSIGMVVRLHSEVPSFRTKPVLRVLDRKPVLDEGLLTLTEWIHRFYYCSWGEAIQATLPPGLNFQSEKRVRVAESVVVNELNELEKQMVEEFLERSAALQEVRKRWRDGDEAARLKSLLRRGVLEIWEEPSEIGERRSVVWWDRRDERQQKRLESQLPAPGKEAPKWVEGYRLIATLELPAPQKELIQHPLLTPYTLKRMEKEGLIQKFYREEPSELSDEAEDPDSISVLTEAQEDLLSPVVEAMESDRFRSFLLHGVTGSGKTEIYIHALKRALELGKGAVILVPEIALTPQTVYRFRRIFGNRIAVLHSRLGDRERAEAWRALQSGEKRVAIGPRSALFAPVQNPGLYVIDEEHDSSYKQFDPAPRYHARDVALVRARQEEAVVIMGSATPSMNSLYAARKGKHTLLELPERPGGEMPNIRVLDLKHYRNAMRGPLTVELFQAIEGALSRKEQVILLYNRRGYATYIQCGACGHIPQSPDCSVSLTYHRKRDLLLCHYSGYSRRVDRACESCGSSDLILQGSGTQQVEEEVARLFPDAVLLRMDRDSTSGKYAHQKIYDRFLSGQADILIGTQLVSKGLDFPNVTVVGVLQAENELAFPSYRSGERLFQLISQVAGRAGRAEKRGHVWVQTWKPDHPAVGFAQRHDYHGFAKSELEQRMNLLYPPYSRLAKFEFKSRSSGKAAQSAEVFAGLLRRNLPAGSVHGPAPAVIEWMHGHYYWEVILKLKPGLNADGISTLFDRMFEEWESEKPDGSGSVRINVNVDATE
ncbi:MAG: primosomal protein N' [Balneolaceae bacterium]